MMQNTVSLCRIDVFPVDGSNARRLIALSQEEVQAMPGTVALRQDGAVAVIVVDNPPVNALSHDVRTALVDAFSRARDDAKTEAIVLTAQGRTFVAGADITEFDKPPMSPGLSDVIALIDAIKKPVVAAVFGTPLGGGLEITLACHFRIAQTGTRLGLPEIKLGLIPGAGGTQRLPRVVGMEKAAAMILSGDPIPAKDALAAGLIALCDTRGASSVHATFLPEDEWRLLATQGFLQRTDQQFHFENNGYASFEHFLSALSSRKRKFIRRERREALPEGVTIHHLTGADLTEAVWDAFFAFYMETGSRKWGRPYLTRKFFSLIGQSMPDRVLLIMARRAGRWIAGAINFIGSDTLYGRHWGAIEHHPFLHFEVCYYQAIDYAITHGLKRVEAGAQGEHKIARGYEPVTTYSAHYIADPGLRRAIADYLKRERSHVAVATEELAAYAPFRKDKDSVGE